MIKFYSIILLTLLPLTSIVYADDSCAQNPFGQIFCAPPGGGAKMNSIGQIICGPGHCNTNSFGQVICSSVPGGGAMTNNFGQVLCVGGCLQGSASYCLSPH
jgi:hypothetical protein